MKVSLKTITPNAEIAIVEIARVSSSRKDKSEKTEGLINYLIKHKHYSPFEHGYMTLEIETSKAIGIQLLRHRSFTFQEFSQRYSTVTKIEPIELREQHKNNRQSSTDVFDPCMSMDGYFAGFTPDAYLNASSLIEGHIEETLEFYNKLLEAGVARECARMVLPMATSTTIYMTGSIRSWIHLIDIRSDSHAQKEIQLISEEMRSIFINQLPIISKALGWKK